MATVSGTSVAGVQRVVGYGALTVAQLEIIIPALKLNNPTKIGYGWITARDNASPNNVRVIQRAPIFAPGVFYTFPNNYGFSTVQYAWFIAWNAAGFGWTVTFA